MRVHGQRRSDRQCMDDRRTFGGFFPLEKSTDFRGNNTRIAHLTGAIQYYNARSAIAGLILANSITDVVLPHYICPVVIKTVEQAGARGRFFPVSPSFRIDASGLEAMVRRDSLLIVPDYFGVYMPDLQALSAIRSRTGCRILLDYAQALYEPCTEEFAAVYSPRKFLGVPDGGFLTIGETSDLIPPAQPGARVDPSIFAERISCHALRGEYPSGEYLTTFRTLEERMPCGSFRMSGLALSMFMAFDHDRACEKRIRNYDTLSAALGRPTLQSNGVPLCFPEPVAPGRFEDIRQHLIEKGVFVPFYWPGLPDSMSTGRGVICLPVDHRYTCNDMVSIFEEFIRTSNGRQT